MRREQRRGQGNGGRHRAGSGLGRAPARGCFDADGEA